MMPRKNITPREFYASKEGTWTGCDWTTEHGASKLDLDGVTAEEAREAATSLMFSTEESADWSSAAKWLEEVEINAAVAQTQARKAVEQYEEGEYMLSLVSARCAGAIEAMYGRAPTWGRLAEVIASAAAEIFQLVAEGERQCLNEK